MDPRPRLAGVRDPPGRAVAIDPGRAIAPLAARVRKSSVRRAAVAQRDAVYQAFVGEPIEHTLNVVRIVIAAGKPLRRDAVDAIDGVRMRFEISEYFGRETGRFHSGAGNRVQSCHASKHTALSSRIMSGAS